MRPMIIETAQNRWLHSNPKNKELSIADRIRSIHPGKKTIIVGTIFKEMPLKPKVLEEYTKEVCDFHSIFSTFSLFVIVNLIVFH